MSTQTIKPITHMVLNHLLSRVTEQDEPALLSALEVIEFSEHRLKYYTQNGQVHLIITPGPLEGIYSRNFLVTMMLADHRWAFKDYYLDLKALVTGTVILDLDIITNLLEFWTEDECDAVVDLIELFRYQPMYIDFNWQIVGMDRVSVEPVDSSEVFTFSLAVLDYLRQAVKIEVEDG